MPTEQDPHGLSAHQPGAKLDAGKPRPGLVLSGFSRALQAVTDVGTYGATKYSDNGWMQVQDGQARYTDALFRHLLAEASGEQRDPDTQILHAAHAAWNALARLDLMLRQESSPKAGRPKDLRTLAFQYGIDHRSLWIDYEAPEHVTAIYSKDFPASPSALRATGRTAAEATIQLAELIAARNRA